MNLIQTMTSGENLSVTEKDIVAYIFQNGDEVINMAISELADATYTSNAAIIRLCKKLGLDGFRQFKIEYTKALEERRQQKVYVDYNYPFHALENPKEIANDIATLTRNSVSSTYNNLDTRLLYQIAEELLKARNVYVYATGDSEITSMGFINRCLKIGINLINTNATSESLAMSTYATSKDIALFVTYQGNSINYQSCCKVLKNRNVKIISITAHPESPVGKFSNYIIPIANYEDQVDSIATFYSQISFGYILNVLYSYMYRVQYEENHTKKSRTDYLNNNLNLRTK